MRINYIYKTPIVITIHISMFSFSVRSWEKFFGDFQKNRSDEQKPRDCAECSRQ